MITGMQYELWEAELLVTEANNRLEKRHSFSEPSSLRYE